MDLPHKVQKIIALSASILALCFFALNAHAQTLGSESVAPMQYIVAPEAPGPHQAVYIEAQGVGDFLGNSNITWTLNGKVISSGVGVRTFSFVTGGVGTQSIVTISVSTRDYGLITRTFTFNPSNVNLTWEANTMVPPMYAGRSLATPGSTIKVVAFPQVTIGGKTQDPSTLSYQWKRNGALQTADSGLGHYAYIFNSDQLQLEEDISVDVLSGNNTVGHADLVVPMFKSFLLFYQHDPLRGVLYNRALTSPYTMGGTELTVHAEPYFFSTNSAARGFLTYGWQLNGTDTQGPSTAQGELTLRKAGSGQGSAQLSVSLQNNESDKLLQSAQSGLTIVFGGQASPFLSLFGL